MAPAVGECRGAGGSRGGVAEAQDCSAAPPLSPEPDPTGSYLQVVVEKHKRKRDHPPAAGSTRLPTASSPIRAQCLSGCGAESGDAGGVWARGAVLLACPATGPLPGHARAHALFAPATSLAYYLGENVAGEDRTMTGAVTGSRGDGDSAQQAKPKKYKSWHMFRESAHGNYNDDRDGGSGRFGEGAEPECVEVYRFERVGAWLSAGGARRTSVQRRTAAGVRAARVLVAELGAAMRLVAGAPLHAAVLALRCTLQVARDAVQGAVGALSDYALKPALALAFNALAHPVLVFIANLLEGVRAALSPACGALQEGAAVGAVLLRAVRLVDVQLHYPAPTPAPSQPAPASALPHHCGTCGAPHSHPHMEY